MKKYVMALGMVCVMTVIAAVAMKSYFERRDKAPCEKIAPRVVITDPKKMVHKCQSGKDSVEFSFQIEGFVCKPDMWHLRSPDKWDFVCTAK